MKNEKINITKEKMIKRCKKVGDIMEIVFWLSIIILVISTVIGSIGAIGLWNEGASGVDIINEFTDTIRYVLDIETDFSEINAIKETTISIMVRILSLIVLYALSKIFIDTSKAETPFSLNNIKNMRKICICTYIVFFVTLFSSEHGIGLVYVLAIAGIEYMFRYGYKLQIESDETL